MLLACLGAAPADAAPIEQPDVAEQLALIEQLNERGQLEQARTVLARVRPRIELPNGEHSVEFILLEAHNLGLRGELEPGLEMLEQLLEHSLTPLTRLRALSLAINLAGVAGHHQRAFDYLRIALPLETEVDHPRHRSSLLSNAADLFARAGESGRAIELARKAVALADLSGSRRELCVARQRLATAYRFSQDQTRMPQKLSAAITSCQEADDRVFLASLITQLADLRREQGDFVQAQQLISESLELLEHTNYQTGKPFAQLIQARLLHERGEPAAAFELAAAQIEPLQRLQKWQTLIEGYQFLSDTALELGDPEQAVALRAARMQAAENFSARNRERRLAYLQTIFELEQRDREIKLLREQARSRNLSSQAQTQQTQLRRLSYGALTLLMLLLFLLLVRTVRERRHYRRLSRRDSLTGLLNHSHFFESAAKLRRNGQTVQPLCLILADIDHFKRINDQYGHLYGDQALKRVAAELRDAFPDPAIVGRIGGEEFAIALPDCDIDQATWRVERLRQAVNRSAVGDKDRSVTISFGLIADREGRDMDAMRKLADQALYRAKHQGRNRLCVAAQAS